MSARLWNAEHVGLIEDIDAQASELRTRDDTYEVAAAIASTAAQYCPGGWHFDEDNAAGLAAIAASVRDVFGTWAQRIHTHGHVDGATEAEALDAHRRIEMAVNDWLGSGRLDPAGFVNRWLPVVGRVDIAWLQGEPGTGR